MRKTTISGKNRKALFLVFLVIADASLYWLPLYTSFPWISDSAYSAMGTMLQPAVVLTIVGIILFLVGSRSPGQAKVSNENEEDFFSERTSNPGKLHGALRALLVLVLVAAGLCLVWVVLVVTGLSRQTY